MSVPEVPAEKDPPVPRPNSQTLRHRPLHRPTVYSRNLPFDDVLLRVLSAADDVSSLSSFDFDPPRDEDDDDDDDDDDDVGVHFSTSRTE